MPNNKPIGVFDSGVGGLTVVSRLVERMPNEKIIYFGDTARVPYGSKSTEAITRFSFEIADFLMKQDVKLVVVACNTITATCLPELQAWLPVPVFGVLEPAAAALLELSGIEKMKKVGVIATERTVKSEKYRELLNEKMPGVTVLSKPCPLFVPLVEEGLLDGEITRMTVSYYLSWFIDNGAEALILGCTHYPLLYDAINEFCGSKIKIIDPAKKLAEIVCAYLKESGASSGESAPVPPTFYVSDKTGKFGMISKLALGKEYDAIVAKGNSV